MKLLAAALAVFVSSHGAVAAPSCSCDGASSNTRRSRSADRKGPKITSFLPAKVKGESYLRPAASAAPYTSRGSRTVEATDPDCTADQVHIALGDDLGSMVVSYATYAYDTAAKVTFAHSEDAVMSDSSAATVVTGTTRVNSELLYIITRLTEPTMGEPAATPEEIIALQDTSTWAYDKETGEHFFNWYNVTEVQHGFGDYNNPYMIYDSPMLHTVVLTGLEPLVTYYYRVEGSCDVHQFTMPPFSYDTAVPDDELYPFLMGMVGDLGQTQVSVGSMEALADMEPDTVLLVGDLCYADGYESIWDTFGRAFEIIGAQVPVMTTGGNHEVQSGENWVPYSLRYKTPFESSGSHNPAYWGREIGPIHVIAVNSYAGTFNTSIQYTWLKDYLSTRINRARTPWVVLMTHTPWYCSNTIHWKEGELTRLSMESMAYEYGVDIVLSGHIHAYERTLNVFDEALDPCGPMHLIIGDGGNYEGPATPWRVETDTGGAPEWSAFRESSFGVGGLNIVNSTHAFFSWSRHACASDSEDTYHMNFSSSCVTPDDNSANAMDQSDEVWVVRPSKSTCPNRHFSTQYVIPPPNSANDNTSDDDDDGADDLVIILSVLASVFGATIVILLFGIYYLYQQAYGKSEDALLVKKSSDVAANSSSSL